MLAKETKISLMDIKLWETITNIFIKFDELTDRECIDYIKEKILDFEELKERMEIEEDSKDFEEFIDHLDSVINDLKAQKQMLEDRVEFVRDYREEFEEYREMI